MIYKVLVYESQVALNNDKYDIPGVSFFPTTSGNTEGFVGVVALGLQLLVLGLSLWLGEAQNGMHRLRFAGRPPKTSQSRDLLSVAHAIFNLVVDCLNPGALVLSACYRPPLDRKQDAASARLAFRFFLCFALQTRTFHQIDPQRQYGDVKLEHEQLTVKCVSCAV